MSGGGPFFWAVQGLLVGALALLSGISLKREAAIHSLNRLVSYGKSEHFRSCLRKAPKHPFLVCTGRLVN